MRDTKQSNPFLFYMHGYDKPEAERLEPIRTYEENGHTVKVYPPRYALGAKKSYLADIAPSRAV